MSLTTNSAGSLKNLFTAILLTGLVAGTLDGLAAIANYLILGGKKPEIIFKYIASGVFGKKAYSSGPIMIVWGVLFHFLIAYGLTVFYFWLYPRVQWLRQQPVVAGLLYGVFAWIMTTRVIIPYLSKINQKPFVFTWDTAISIAILMVFIGLPVSLMTKKHYLYKK